MNWDWALFWSRIMFSLAHVNRKAKENSIFSVNYEQWFLVNSPTFPWSAPFVPFYCCGAGKRGRDTLDGVSPYPETAVCLKFQPHHTFTRTKPSCQMSLCRGSFSRFQSGCLSLIKKLVCIFAVSRTKTYQDWLEYSCPQDTLTKRTRTNEKARQLLKLTCARQAQGTLKLKSALCATLYKRVSRWTRFRNKSS